MVWFYDFKQVNEYGFFQGYNGLIWIVVLLQVCTTFYATSIFFLSWDSIQNIVRSTCLRAT